MKTRNEVSAEKLRGGFYTPPPLVDRVLERALGRLNGHRALHVIEPSAGDGAFVSGLDRSEWRTRIQEMTAIELVPEEAAACRQRVIDCGVSARVLTEDFLVWQRDNRANFHAAVGNPPFVRFQFIGERSKQSATELFDELGLTARGMSNLWIPILLGSLNLLRDGGVFGFVVPTECFTGVSAGAVRSWLLHHCADIKIDLFPPGSFPDVLQEIAILSGIRRKGSSQVRNSITFVEHGESGPTEWSHEARATPKTWTRYLLSPAELDAYRDVCKSADVSRLVDVAKFEVAAVTGANAFFSVDKQTIDEFELGPWARPLLPRIRFATGLTFTRQDHERLIQEDVKAALLDFSSEHADRDLTPGAARYIEQGEDQDLHRRYKTRIRDIWYEIPLVRSEQLLLSKRSHWFPRVVLNEAEVVTTDTIYRGWITSPEIDAVDFVASFHNSLTLLSAEVEGRNFGGGVLELVPSEIARLAVPISHGFGGELHRLDALSRDGQVTGLDVPLIEETNALIAKSDVSLSAEDLALLEAGRQKLAKRRLDRTG